MSAFSRGFLFQAQCLRASSTASIPRAFTVKLTPQAFSVRPFSTSQLLRYSAKKPRNITKSPTLKQKPSPASMPVRKPTIPLPLSGYSNFAATLAAKSHPTILYQAPSHTLYIIAAYSAGLSCFAYAVWNFNAIVVNTPEGIHWAIPYAFGGICFLVVCLGGWLLLAPARIIRTISTVPFITPGTAKRSLRLEIELRKMLPLPFFPARKILAAPGEVFLDKPLYVPPSKTTQYKKQIDDVNGAWRRKAQDKSILTLPFRQMSLLFHKLFIATARIWTRDGFLKLEAKGQMYKLDVTGGWGLDEGRALDKLVKIRLGE